MRLSVEAGLHERLLLHRVPMQRWAEVAPDLIDPGTEAKVPSVVHDHVEVRQGRDTHYGFHFVPDEGGEPVDIETSIILPGWARPEVFNGRTFRIVYLQSNTRALKNGAINIEILSGRDSGFYDSVDARPFGVWLAIPFGAALAAFGYFGLRYKKDDGISAASNDDMS
jgi:hypothetical protein